MADQDLSVALFEGLRDDPVHAAPGGTIAYAWAHRAVIRRFGRFPHRNAALGRAGHAGRGRLPRAARRRLLRQPQDIGHRFGRLSATRSHRLRCALQHYLAVQQSAF